MKKIVKLVGLCCRPLQTSYLATTDEARRALREDAESEPSWIIDRMRTESCEKEASP